MGTFGGKQTEAYCIVKPSQGAEMLIEKKDIGLKRFASIAQKTKDLSRWENYPDVSFIVRQFIIHTNPD